MSPAGPIQLPLQCPAKYYPDFLPAQETAELFDWIGEESGVPDMREIPLADGSLYKMDNGKLKFVDPERTRQDRWRPAFTGRGSVC